MKFENAIIYNGKFYRTGEEVPVAERIEKVTNESTTVATIDATTTEVTTVEKAKRRAKQKTEVN